MVESIGLCEHVLTDFRQVLADDYSDTMLSNAANEKWPAKAIEP